MTLRIKSHRMADAYLTPSNTGTVKSAARPMKL